MIDISQIQYASLTDMLQTLRVKAESNWQIVKNEISSQWQHHKVKILSGALVLAIASIASYRFEKPSNGCVNGFYDDWGCARCENGEWLPSQCLPEYERYKELIDLCAGKTKMPGCFHGSYYRELSVECKENPIASLCDGNYDHAAWVKQVYEVSSLFSEMHNNSTA